MKVLITALEIITAALSASVAVIILLQERAPWALIGLYWSLVAVRNVLVTRRA